jgi:hypothetical protein
MFNHHIFKHAFVHKLFRIPGIFGQTELFKKLLVFSSPQEYQPENTGAE